MAIQFDEFPKSRSISGNPPSETRLYWCTGTADPNDVIAFALSATPSIVTGAYGILYRQAPEVAPGGTSYHRVTVKYDPAAVKPGGGGAPGSWSFRFSTTGGTVHITNSKETRDRYAAGGNPFIPEFEGSIDVAGDEVRGTDIVIPVLNMTVDFSHPKGQISIAKVKALASITGTVNSTSFLGFDPGEVLFLGCDGADGTNADATLSYHFACSQNAQGLTFGDITGVDKRGWDHIWILYKDAVDTGYPVKQPEYAYIERVYEEVDLKAALGFG